MGDDGLAGHCTDKVGVADFVGALLSVGDGGAWFVSVAVCCSCLVRVRLQLQSQIPIWQTT